MLSEAAAYKDKECNRTAARSCCDSGGMLWVRPAPRKVLRQLTKCTATDDGNSSPPSVPRRIVIVTLAVGLFGNFNLDLFFYDRAMKNLIAAIIL